MKSDTIIAKLNDIPDGNFSLEDYKNELQEIKNDFVNKNYQIEAKQIWIYQTIIEVHSLYQNAFELLKNKKHYEGWCALERAEIELNSLKRHFQYNKKQFNLWQIEKSIRNMQIIFPYRLFSSIELLIKEEECTVCNQKVSIRKPCGHIAGEIYNGEICGRKVTDLEMLGLALVTNPENKFAVMFPTDEKTGEKIDRYNYYAVDFLFGHIKNPYEQWDLVVTQKIVSKENYKHIGRNDDCPCGSGKKFKKCCSEKIGNKYPHFEFVFSNSSNEHFPDDRKII